MSNKFYAGLSVAVVCALFFTGCGQRTDQVLPEPTPETVADQMVDTSKTNELAQDTALSNPATVYCLQEGGEFVMKKTLDGATEGFCILPNNITCEVWAHYQGDCPTKQRSEQDDEIEEKTEDEMNSEEGESEDTTPSNPEIDDQDQTGTSEEPGDENKGTSFEQLTEVKDENDLELSVEAGEEPGELINSWKTNGLKAPEGFYVMLSGEDTVEYPTKYTHELKNSQSRSFVWTGLTPQKIYYFRVCIIENGDCKYYSSVVSGTVQ